MTTLYSLECIIKNLGLLLTSKVGKYAVTRLCILLAFAFVNSCCFIRI